MVKRRGGRRRQGRRRGGQQAVGFYIEVLTFSVEIGNTATILVSTLADRPPRSNFRPKWMEVEYASFVPGTTSLAPSFTPVGFQFALGYGANVTVGGLAQDKVSRLRLATTAPKKERIHTPVSAQWFSYQTTGTTEVAILTAVCVGVPAGSESTAYVRGICRIGFQLQEEDSASTCPTMIQAHSSDSLVVV